MSNHPPVVCVIPSRYAAQRFPGKPLALLAGKPMIRWVWESAMRTRGVDEVLIATDDERIRAAAQSFGARVVMTSPECPSGSDRIAAALAGREVRAVVNWQGDEPLMHPETVGDALAALMADPHAAVATACVPITDRAIFENPMVVKVVRGKDNACLYFSRSPIPSPARLDAAVTRADGFVWGHKHLGLYVYRPEALRAFLTLPRPQIEITESLEQLRFLAAGYRIVCVDTPYDSSGIDTPDDMHTAERRVAALGFAAQQ